MAKKGVKCEKNIQDRLSTHTRNSRYPFVIGLFVESPEEKETLRAIKENTPTIRETPEKAVMQETAPARKLPLLITLICKNFL